MIWQDFQTAIVDRLKSDAYFSQAPAIPIFAEESEDELTDDSIEAFRKRVQDELSNGGIVVAISEVDYELTERRDTFKCTATIAIFENRKKVKESSGPKRSGKMCEAVSFSRLLGYRPPFTSNGVRYDPFSRILIQRGSFVGEEEGIKVRELAIESTVPVAVVNNCIATESGLLLVTENDQPFLITPSTP